MIRTFNWPISEEQAWAVIHQTVRTLKALLDADTTQNRNLVLVTSSSHILLNQDGSIAHETFYSESRKSGIHRIVWHFEMGGKPATNQR